MRDIAVVDFDTPLGHLVMRDGRRVPIVRADVGTAQLARRLAMDPSDTDIQVAILRRLMPEATEGDVLGLNNAVIDAVIQRALHGITEVETLLGESSGASPSPTNDSAPEIPMALSAAGSPPSTG